MSEYLHGYSKKEQRRLAVQAQYLEPFVYPQLRLSGRRILEVGVGVGAQTQILLRRLPQAKFVGVDVSPDQLATAARNLRRPIYDGRVELRLSDGKTLPAENSHFDGAFLCWVLEHVPDPLKLLKQTQRSLRQGGRIWCSEVFNNGLYTTPDCPALQDYWSIYNQAQIKSGGSPYIGAELGNLLKAAGFRKIQFSIIPMHFDDRNPQARRDFCRYFSDLLLSGSPLLIGKGLVKTALVKKMRGELASLGKRNGSVISFHFVQAQALK